MRFLESIINMKINNIRRDELMSLAQQHGVVLTLTEADRITEVLRGKNYNLFNGEQRRHIVSKIAAIIGNDRAMQIEQIFLSFTGR
ncbi:DUF2624 family protein [Bacillus massiliigorillae]|uniref:DUF2624 family protein n=1 Tax=Bacillus massiliigorillae TaxID=1243664 RepID=UPI0003A0DA41|nr:DUF2624 family protein [Bacillus massiliigorillae]